MKLIGATITRKEIAEAVGISEDTAARRGLWKDLEPFKSTASRRPFIYFRAKVLQHLIQRGLLME